MSDTALDPQVFRIGMSRPEADAQPDPSAPFGREEDGTPVAPFGLRIDGGVKLKPGKTAANPRPSTQKPTRAPQKRRSGVRRPTGGSSSPSRSGATRGSVDYQPAIRSAVDGLHQLALFAGATVDEIFYADAVVIQHAADPIAKGLNPLVNDVPWLGKALQWIERNSPYAGLTAALGQVAGQLAANHLPQLRPMLIRLGVATDPAVIIAGVKLELARAAEAEHRDVAQIEAEVDEIMQRLADASRNGDDAQGDDDTDIMGPPAPPDLVGHHDELHRLVPTAEPF